MDDLAHLSCDRSRDPENVYAAIEKRRVMVQQLWAEGMSQRSSAHAMEVSLCTVQRDLEVIRMELATEERSTTASQRQDKHLAALRALKDRNYHLLNQLKGQPTAQYYVGALRLLLEIEQVETRLDGSNLPHAISARVAATFQDAVIELLMEEGGPALVRRVAEGLRGQQRASSTPSGEGGLGSFRSRRGRPVGGTRAYRRTTPRQLARLCAMPFSW